MSDSFFYPSKAEVQFVLGDSFSADCTKPVQVKKYFETEFFQEGAGNKIVKSGSPGYIINKDLILGLK
jgi:hypothetical protein